VIIEQNARY